MKMPKKPGPLKSASVKTTFETLKPSGLGTGMGEIDKQEVAQQMGKVGYKNPPKEHQFKSGDNPNPGGRPVASRNKLQGSFLRDLAADFELHGKKAIQRCREEKPEAYIRTIASLMPKELELVRPLQEMTDDEINAGVAALQAYGIAKGLGSGISVAPISQSTH